MGLIQESHKNVIRKKLSDLKGQHDPIGYELHATVIATADEIASHQAIRPDDYLGPDGNPISVLVVGHVRNGNMYQYLPAQPPIALDEIVTCNRDEIAGINRRTRNLN